MPLGLLSEQPDHNFLGGLLIGVYVGEKMALGVGVIWIVLWPMSVCICLGLCPCSIHREAQGVPTQAAELAAAEPAEYRRQD